MGATIKDVAQQAGVTDTTVSLAFQAGSRISAHTRTRVLAIAQELGYVPNALARQLRRGHSRIPTLGLLVNDIANPFYGLIVRAAEQAALQQQYHVAVSDTQWDPRREVAAIQGMIEARVDGVLACFSERTEESRALLERFSIPYLAVDTCPTSFPGAYVINDMAAAGRIATEHLLAAGYRTPVFLSAEPEQAHFSAFQAMLGGFRQAIHAASLPLTDAMVRTAGQTIACGITAFESLITAVPDCDAVVCINSLCALGVMEAAERCGVAIGDDLGVLGVDDLDICGLTRIGLTTIRQPYAQLAATAATVLIQHIQTGDTLTTRLALAPELVMRQSTCRGRG